MSKQTFVIVGASLAGAKAAEELRQRGFDGHIMVVGAESERPYERPQLSKDYLRGESEREKIFVQPEAFDEKQEIELLIGVQASAIDLELSTITLDDGRALGYDKLLITTGAEPHRLSGPGSDLEGIYYLRTVADCELLRQRLHGGGRVAVVGAGWIGSEVAASARQKGLEVTLVDPLEVPNERIFGPEIGSFYRDVHARHGIHLALGEGVAAVVGDGRVTAVRTNRGTTIECDLVVVGIGVTPRVQLAAEAGLELNNGIVVNDKLQTSAPNVFAAGDVANAWHPFYQRHIRVEHWANALNQGPAAARAMLDEPVSYDRIPYFFSDQYELGMEYSGFAVEWDQVVFRGDRDSGDFIAFWLKDRRVLAGMNVNVWDVNQDIQALIHAGQPVDVVALRDPDTPLDSLLDPVPADSR